MSAVSLHDEPSLTAHPTEGHPTTIPTPASDTLCHAVVVESQPQEARAGYKCATAPPRHVSAITSMVAGMVAVLVMVALPSWLSSIVSPVAVDTQALTYLAGMLMWWSLGGVGGGIHLLRKGRGVLGGVLLTIGLLATALPGAMFLFAGRSAPTLSELDRQPLVIEIQGTQRVARHPTLRFSVPLAAHLEPDGELAKQIMSSDPTGSQVYAFSGNDSGIVCMLTPPFRNSARLPEEFVKGALSKVDPSMLVGEIHRSGSGVRIDVRYTIEFDGIRIHNRIYMTPGTRGNMFHAIFLGVKGLDDAEAAYIVDGCTSGWPVGS